MNIDFHYYGTYVAARFAGYTRDEATTIAHAAQYVDDSTKDKLLQREISETEVLKPIPTVKHMTSMVHTDFVWTEDYYNELLRVWPVFHFLPGNYNSDGSYKRPYVGKREDNSFLGMADKWSFDKQAEMQFKLVCLPNSILTEKMVNDLKDNHRDNLHAIGLRMHVLADTWAHTYHAGIPAWFINQEGSNYIKNAKTYNDIIYLGHASTGHQPDNPSLAYDIAMQWNNYQKERKNNPSDYIAALTQMAQAMNCIRNGLDFENNKYFAIAESEQEKLRQIIATNTTKLIVINTTNDQSDIWKREIPSLCLPDGQSLEVPEKYDADKWVNVIKGDTLSPDQIQNTDYYKFNLAAINHLAFVKDKLRENDIYLDDEPEDWILNFYVRDAKNNYVSNIYNGINFFYPTYSGTVPTHKLQFIFPNKSQPELLSGDIAYIKTREEYAHKITGPAKYLGSWRDSTHLYFYARDYNPQKQKWIIAQDGKAVGSPIDINMPVTIKNVFFDSEPYLAPADEFLTTQKDEYKWYLVN